MAEENIESNLSQEEIQIQSILDNSELFTKEEEIVNEAVVEEVEVEAPIVEEVVVEEPEEEIEDRVVVESKAEPVVEKKEVVLEAKKAAVPFKNETQKIIYNYLSENEGGVQEISNILSKAYEKLTPVQLIDFDIRSNPDNVGASEALIKKKVAKALKDIEGDYDLYDADDNALYEEELSLKATRIKSSLDKKRAEMIEKYSSDVEIEYQQEVEPQKSDEELALEKESLVSKAEQDFMERLKDMKVSIQDKDGPIFVPIENMKSIAESVVDPIGFITQNFVDKNGEFMFEAYAKWVNYGLNPGFHDNISIKRGIAIGKKQVVGGIKNKTTPMSRNTTQGNNSVNPDTGLPYDLSAFTNAQLSA